MQLIGFFVILFSIFGWITFIYKITVNRLSVATAPFLAVSTISFFLFYGGFFHQLYFTRDIIVIFGLFCIPYYSFRLHKDKHLVNLITSPSIIFFFLSCIILYILFDGIGIAFDGDLMYGAGIIKEYLRLNKLPDRDYLIGSRDYHPGNPLFTYLLFWNNSFSERIAYLGKNILDIAALATIFTGITLKNYSGIILRLLFCFLIINILGQGFHSLWQDQPLGLYFGGILSCYFLNQRCLHWTYLFPLFHLSLIKMPGSCLGLATLAIIFTDKISIIKFNQIKNVVYTIFSIIFLALTAILPDQMWRYYSKTYGAIAAWVGKMPTTSLYPCSWSDAQTNAVNDVTKQLISAEVSGKYPFSSTFSLTLLGWITIFLILIISSRRFFKSNKQLFLVVATVLLCFCAWILAVYYAYLTVLVNAERFSAVRYASAFILGIIFCFGSINIFFGNKNSIKIIILIVVLYVSNAKFTLADPEMLYRDGTINRMKEVKSWNMDKVLTIFQKYDPITSCYIVDINPSYSASVAYQLNLDPRFQKWIVGKATNPAISTTDLSKELSICRRIYTICDSTEKCEIGRITLKSIFNRFPQINQGITLFEKPKKRWRCISCKNKYRD
jgi:hypothetical protein